MRAIKLEIPSDITNKNIRLFKNGKLFWLFSFSIDKD